MLGDMVVCGQCGKAINEGSAMIVSDGKGGKNMPVHTDCYMKGLIFNTPYTPHHA